MGNSFSFKSMSLGIIKILSFIFSFLLLREIVLIPLTLISKKYWSEFDGRGLNEPWFLTHALAIFFTILFITFLFLKYIEKKDFSYIRITFDNYKKYFAYGFFISSAAIISFVITNLILGNFNISIELDSILKIFSYLFILSIGLLALVIYEEIVWRGYILKTIENHFNLITAVIFSSLLFSASHYLNPNTSFLGFFNIFLAGVFLSLLCVYFNNLILPIGFHLGWNFFLWFFNLPVSGSKFPNPILKLENKEYNLITGSKFGPEDSLVLTVLLGFLILYFLYKYNSKQKTIFGITFKLLT